MGKQFFPDFYANFLRGIVILICRKRNAESILGLLEGLDDAPRNRMFEGESPPARTNTVNQLTDRRSQCRGNKAQAKDAFIGSCARFFLPR